MKQIIYLSILFATVQMFNSSCSKNNGDSVPHHPSSTDETRAVSRKIQFSLYTQKNFKDYSQPIQFSVFIRNASNQILWDTMLPLMSVRDIPNLANKISFERSIPDSDSSLLRTGFVYAIENVGVSWHLDTCNKSTAVKLIDFSFQ